MSAQTDTSPGATRKMSVPTLAGLVVGGMVGAGVFSLPARFGVANLAESLLQGAFPAEIAHPRIVELVEGRSARNRALRLAFQALDVHRRSVSSCR